MQLTPEFSDLASRARSALEALKRETMDQMGIQLLDAMEQVLDVVSSPDESVDGVGVLVARDNGPTGTQ